MKTIEEIKKIFDEAPVLKWTVIMGFVLLAGVMLVFGPYIF